MIAALRGSYVEYVYFMGVTEKYPPWFEEELYDSVYMDENRYTFYQPLGERKPDYYDKILVEDYTVFLRKPNGDIHVTDYDIFKELYTVFRYDSFTNSGVAAFNEDCIEYVECLGGVLPAGYPEWFYEYFTEALNFPRDSETIYFYDNDKHSITASRDFLEVPIRGEATVKEHCVFLRNKFGEIRGMTYDEFLIYYDDDPELGRFKW
jgi:hypothetical protein